MPPATASEERSQTASQTQVADFPKQRHGVRKAQTILMEYLRGWTEYYNLADMGNKVVEVDQWLRRRLRMCIRKSWKRARTRIHNLIRCGIEKRQAYLCVKNVMSKLIFAIINIVFITRLFVVEYLTFYKWWVAIECLIILFNKKKFFSNELIYRFFCFLWMGPCMFKWIYVFS